MLAAVGMFVSVPSKGIEDVTVVALAAMGT